MRINHWPITRLAWGTTKKHTAGTLLEAKVSVVFVSNFDLPALETCDAQLVGFVKRFIFGYGLHLIKQVKYVKLHFDNRIHKAIRSFWQ